MKTKKELLEERAALLAEAQKAETTLDRLKEIETRMTDIDTEIKAIDEAAETRDATISRISAMRGVSMDPAVRARESHDEDEDQFSTMEYRRAFMDYVVRGRMSEHLAIGVASATPGIQMRADANTTTSDIPAFIMPTQIRDRIIQSLVKDYDIYSRVTKTNYPAGFSIPVADLVPEADYITETQRADLQGFGATDTLSFTICGIQCNLSQTLFATVMAIDAFENVYSAAAAKAILRKLNTEIFIGDGTAGHILGIVTKALADGKTSTLTEGSWDTIVDLNGLVNENFEMSAEYFMSKNTFADFQKIKDADGNPVARANVGIEGSPRNVLYSRPVNIVPDTWLGGAKRVLIFDIAEYILNDNLGSFHVYREYDPHSLSHRVYTTMLCDGKPARMQSANLVELQPVTP